MARPTIFGEEFGLVLDAVKRNRALDPAPTGQVDPGRNVVTPEAVQAALEAQTIADEAPEEASVVTAPDALRSTREGFESPVAEADKPGAAAQRGNLASALAGLFGSGRKKDSFSVGTDIGGGRLGL